MRWRRSNIHRCSLFGAHLCRCEGFSLVESVISILIVGVMVVAAMNTVGGSQKTQLASAQRDRALLLAQDLMAQIVRKSYEEPDQTPDFGRESGESGGHRDDWDDVDDYDGLSNTPPQYEDGTAISWADGYTRKVTATWMDASDLTQSSGSETGIKGIWVEVLRGDRVLVTLSAMRTNAWLDPLDQ